MKSKILCKDTFNWKFQYRNNEDLFLLLEDNI